MRLFGIVSLALSLAACSGADGKDGATGPAGAQGEAGAAGAAGQQGPAGEDGMDGVDGDTGAAGMDGADGMDGLDVVFATTDAESCDGTAVWWGWDFNMNGELDEDEQMGSFDVCNGEDGLDGEDGHDSLVVSVNDLCGDSDDTTNHTGIVWGVDADDDGLLSESEITGSYDFEATCPDVTTDTGI
jgi:hypothetical protein